MNCMSSFSLKSHNSKWKESHTLHLPYRSTMNKWSVLDTFLCKINVTSSITYLNVGSVIKCCIEIIWIVLLVFKSIKVDVKIISEMVLNCVYKCSHVCNILSEVIYGAGRKFPRVMFGSFWCLPRYCCQKVLVHLGASVTYTIMLCTQTRKNSPKTNSFTNVLT